MANMNKKCETCIKVKDKPLTYVKCEVCGFYRGMTEAEKTKVKRRAR